MSLRNRRFVDFDFVYQQPILPYHSIAPYSSEQKAITERVALTLRSSAKNRRISSHPLKSCRTQTLLLRMLALPRSVAAHGLQTRRGCTQTEGLQAKLCSRPYARPTAVLANLRLLTKASLLLQIFDLQAERSSVSEAEQARRLCKPLHIATVLTKPEVLYANRRVAHLRSGLDYYWLFSALLSRLAR